MTTPTNVPSAIELTAFGLGPARSRSFVSKHPDAAAIVDFARACSDSGVHFEVVQSSGRNGYDAQLRLKKLITGDAPSCNTDSRGHEGPSEGCEVGSMAITEAQVRELAAALTLLATEANIPAEGRPAQVATAKRGMSL